MINELNLPISTSTAQNLDTQKVESRPSVKMLNNISAENKNPNEQQATQDQSPAGEELANVVTEMNAAAQNLQRNLLFSVDENTGGTFVRVVDRETDETVREIPSKEIREIKARLEEVAGMIFNKSV